VRKHVLCQDILERSNAVEHQRGFAVWVVARRLDVLCEKLVGRRLCIDAGAIVDAAAE
jgi:hypothetical protein